MTHTIKMCINLLKAYQSHKCMILSRDYLTHTRKLNKKQHTPLYDERNYINALTHSHTALEELECHTVVACLCRVNVLKFTRSRVQISLNHNLIQLGSWFLEMQRPISFEPIAEYGYLAILLYPPKSCFSVFQDYSISKLRIY